jgi:hypothetical protein
MDSATMNRVRAYLHFTAWFIGLGYIVLWPLTLHDSGFATLEGSFLCGGGSFALLDMLCHPAHALRLSPGLHLIGLVSVACIMLRLLLRPLRRSRRALIALMPCTPATRIPAILRARQKPVRPPRPIKPRKHFGLRGIPH